MIEDIPGGLLWQSSRHGSNVAATSAGDNALTEPCGSVSEDIIDSSLHVAVGIVLTSSLCVQSILHSVETAGIVSLSVSVGGNSDSLAECVQILEVDIVDLDESRSDIEGGRGIQASSIIRSHVTGEGNGVGSLFLEAIGDRMLVVTLLITWFSDVI